MNTTGALWRDTARPVRFFFLDARVLSGFILWVLYMCQTTFWLSLGIIVLFVIVERYGVTVPAAWRLVRQGLFANLRQNCSLYQLRRNARW